MVPITPARSALMRSGDGRSGYPVPVGVKALMYAQSGVMRSGASRSNYHSGKVFIILGGVHVGTGRTGPGRILADSLSIHDGLNETPTTATATAIGIVPTVGQEVIIQLGSMNTLHREFGGTILRTDHGALTSDPMKDQIGLSLIDYTWGLDARKVSGYYTGSASTIALVLLGTYAPGYSGAGIALGLPAPSGGITFTNADLTDCLTQLAKRIGSSWACDYSRVVSIPAARPDDPNPSILNSVHPSLRDFSHSQDFSQAVTRVYVEGGGVRCAATCAAGETIVPLDGDPGWYDPAGGTVVSGPQRITYTGVSASAGGGLVGTGAAPSGAPSLALASGAGLAAGAHGYAATFVTAAGESIAGPVGTIITGQLAAPATAPVAGTVQPGSGPEVGAHDYAVTFLTAVGETLPGPRVTQTTGLTPDPTTAPIPGVPTYGAGPDPGSHEYAATFVTAIGETLPGPISGAVLTGPLAGPGTGPVPGVPTHGAGPDPGSHEYACSFVTDLGETLPGAFGPAVTTGYFEPAHVGPIPGAPQPGAGLEPGTYEYGVTFLTATGETSGGAIGPAVVITPADTSGAPALGPEADVADGPGVDLNASHAYRVTFVSTIGETAPGPTGNGFYAGQLAAPFFVGVGGSTTGSAAVEWHPGEAVQYSVTFVAAGGETNAGQYSSGYALGLATDSTKAGPMNLSQIPIATRYEYGGGGEVVMSGTKRIYRRTGGTTPAWKLVGTIANSVTTFVDPGNNTGTTQDPPVTNTTAMAVLKVYGIPIGPAGTTARKLYRSGSLGGPRLVTTLGNNTATTYTDMAPYASLGAAPPVSSPAVQVVPLTGIAIGPPGVTGRKLYRRFNAGPGRLVTTIGNNTATTYTDATPNAALSTDAPPGNTALVAVVPLTNIPTGGAGVKWRYLYRRSGGAGLRFLAGLANNSTTTFTDTIPNANLGNAPAGGSAPACVVPVTGIPTGPAGAGVTARKLYRRSGGAGLRLVASWANNSTTTFTDTIANAGLGAAPPASSGAFINQIPLSALPIASSPLVTGRRLYGTAVGNATLRLVAELPLTGTTYLVVTPDASLGAAAPATGTAVTGQVTLSGIPIGAPLVTARKLYRTLTDGAALGLLATIANNTTTTYLDVASDAALGAAPPVVDTSGLTQPTGNVLAGSTSLVVASIGAFPPSGWAVIGNGQQVIRYTGVSGNVLTGIPASGPGAIAATVAFNSTVTSAPVLTGIPAAGIGAIRYPILQGADINIWIMVEDVGAQVARAALLGGDGVQEDYLQDRRLAKAEATARGLATLELKRQPIDTVRYTSRDLNTRAGRTVTVNLGPPYAMFSVPLLIQSVTQTFTLSRTRLLPLYSVEASSVRLTFDQLLAMSR